MRILILAAGLLAATTAEAQEPDSVLLRTSARLRAGTQVRLELRDGSRQRGVFQWARPDGIGLGDSAVRTVPLADISRLWQRKRAVGAGAITGGIIGLGTGAFFGLIATALCEYDCASTGSGIAFGGLLGAAFGAGTGAMIGAAIPRWSTVYRRGRTTAPAGAPPAYAGNQEQPAPRRHIGEFSVLAVAGGGGYPADMTQLLPPDRGGVFGGEIGLAFRAGPLSLGPEFSILRGDHRIWTLGGMARLALGGREPGRKVAPHIVAGLGAYSWQTGIDQTLLTASIGAGITSARGLRLEARWHPSLQNTGTAKPALFTVGAGYRVTW